MTHEGGFVELPPYHGICEPPTGKFDGVEFTVRLSGRCCHRLPVGRARIRFSISLRDMDDSADYGYSAAYKALQSRIEEHTSENLSTGSYTLNFHASRDTWGLKHLMIDLARRRDEANAS